MGFSVKLAKVKRSLAILGTIIAKAIAYGQRKAVLSIAVIFGHRKTHGSRDRFFQRKRPLKVKNFSIPATIELAIGFYEFQKKHIMFSVRKYKAPKIFFSTT